MRKCPTCQSVYTDESLKFCLNDGAALYIPNTEESTQVFNQPIQTHQPIKIPIAQETIQSQFQPNTQSFQSQQKTGGNGFLYAIIGGLAVLLILGVVGIAGWFLIGSKENNSVATVTNKNASPTATATTTPSEIVTSTPTPDETANLKQKVNDLQKQLQQQKQQSSKNNVPITGDNPTIPPPPPQSNEIYAKANSPSDGFLALRTGPSATVGERIMKIPHGATIKVYNCLRPAPGKRGRWCRVDYNGNSGWAFDGYMIYQ